MSRKLEYTDPWVNSLIWGESIQEEDCILQCLGHALNWNLGWITLSQDLRTEASDAIEGRETISY